MRNKFVKAMQQGIYNEPESIIYHSLFAKEVLQLYEDSEDTYEDRIMSITTLPDKWKKSYTTPVIEETPGLSGVQDKRISKIMMHGIKGIRKEDDNTYFGLNCDATNGDICSMVVIGANGIGKTSFYSAMEVAGMGKSNCAKLRGYESDKELAQFMVNIHTQEELGMILIKTGDGNVSSFGFKDNLLNPQYGINISESCFCSDYDIQYLETYSYSAGRKSFTEFIHSQLNLDGFDRTISALKLYRDKLIERGSSIIENTKGIDVLKSDVFSLKIEYALLSNDLYSSRFLDKLSYFFEGGVKGRVLEIEENIKNEKDDKLSICDLRFLYWYYRSELYILCNLIQAFDAGATKNLTKQILTSANGDFFYQSNDDIDKIQVPFIYPKCISILKDFVSNRLSKSQLLKDRNLFTELSKERKEIADIMEKCKIPQSNSLKKKRKAEIAKELEFRYREIDRFKMSLIGKIPVDMTKIDQLIEGCSNLISYLELELCRYDRQIFDLLKIIIPTLCAQSFSPKQGEEIIINYGGASNTNQDNVIVQFEKPKPFELFIRTTSKQVNEPDIEIEKTEPRLYLNTFRHKLFCFALKLGLAICAMKIDRCRYPIVVDDVFDASDFMNRNEISNVIKKLFITYADLVPDLGELQLILLTQDEIIAERVFTGLTHARNRAKLVRLMNPNEYNDSTSIHLKKDLTPEKICSNAHFIIMNLFGRCRSSDSFRITFHEVTDIVRSNFSSER